MLVTFLEMLILIRGLAAIIHKYKFTKLSFFYFSITETVIRQKVVLRHIDLVF